MLQWLKRFFFPDSAMFSMLDQLIQENKTMSANFDALSAQVDASVSEASIAVAKVQELFTSVGALTAQVADLTNQLAIANAGKEDPAAVDALTAKLKVASDALSAALAAVSLPAA